MPAVTLTRLTGTGRSLRAYVDLPEIGEPSATVTYNDAKISLWRAQSEPSTPDWASLVTGAFRDEHFRESGVRESALLIIRLRVDGESCVWAAMFGISSRYWLRGERIDHHAPLVVAFELSRDPETGVLRGFKSVHAAEISQDAHRVTREQPRGGTFYDLKIDTGGSAILRTSAKVSLLRSASLAAGTSLRLTAVRDFGELLDVIGRFEQAYKIGSRRQGLIPGLQPIDDAATVDGLIQALIVQIRAADESVVVSIPESLNGHRFAATISDLPARDGVESITVQHIRDDLMATGFFDLLTPDVLQFEARLVDVTNNEKYYLFDMLHTTIVREDLSYLLIDRQWYGVGSNWLAELNGRVNACLIVDGFPDYQHTKESEYNEDLSRFLSGRCFDRNLLRSVGFGRSALEIADVLSLATDQNNRPCLNVIAVKRGTLSEDISYLLTQAQGALTALGDSVIRAAFYDRMMPDIPPGPLRDIFESLLGTDGTWDPTRVQFTIGIIGRWHGMLVSQRVPLLARMQLGQAIVAAALRGHIFAIAPIEIADDAIAVPH